jgi:hypothetical protein
MNECLPNARASSNQDFTRSGDLSPISRSTSLKGLLQERHMHRLATLLILTLLLTCVSSCRTVKPDGSLKDLVDGELFSGDSSAPPPRHTNDQLMDPVETGGPVRWKVRF